jgi:hypothetical protein
VTTFSSSRALLSSDSSCFLVKIVKTISPTFLMEFQLNFRNDIYQRLLGVYYPYFGIYFGFYVQVSFWGHKSIFIDISFSFMYIVKYFKNLLLINKTQKHLLLSVYQVCSNKSPWVKIGPAPGGYWFSRYVYYSKS